MFLELLDSHFDCKFTWYSHIRIMSYVPGALAATHQPPATNQPTKPLLMSLNERNVEKTGGSAPKRTRKVKIRVLVPGLLGFACIYVVLASPGLWVASGAATLT